MEFVYRQNIIRTTDDIRMTVADLRDLIQALNILQTGALTELQFILDSIARKNRLSPGTFTVSPAPDCAVQPNEPVRNLSKSDVLARMQEIANLNPPSVRKHRLS